MKEKHRIYKIKESMVNQYKLIVYLAISIILSTSIVWFITNNISQYTETYISILSLGGLGEIFLSGIVLILIPSYIIYNIITFIPYLRSIKYNLYFVSLTVLIFMLIPIGIVGTISDRIGFYFANRMVPIYSPGAYTDAVDFYGIISFLMLYPLQFILVILIVGWFFNWFRKVKNER